MLALPGSDAVPDLRVTAVYSFRSLVTLLMTTVLFPGSDAKYNFIRFLLKIPSATSSEYASLIPGNIAGFSRARTSIRLI